MKARRVLIAVAMLGFVLGCGSDSSETSDGGGGGGLTTTAGLCTKTGGKIEMSMCCKSADDFPGTCGVGGCGCAPADSKTIMVCTCPTGKCFTPNGGCVARM